jgi:hypothetical protein
MPKVLIINNEINNILIINKILSAYIGSPNLSRNEYFSIRISGFIMRAAYGAIRPIPRTSNSDITKNRNEIKGSFLLSSSKR